MRRKLVLLFLINCLDQSLHAQHFSAVKNDTQDGNDTVSTGTNSPVTQLDVNDILNKIWNRNYKADTSVSRGRSHSIVPGIDYIPSSGLRANATASFTSYASDFADQKLSSSSIIASYSQKKQAALSIFSNIWTKNNKYTFQGNWWYLHYPEQTYGLGSSTKAEKEDLITYSYIRFYESALKEIKRDLYAGLGYKLDYHYGIKENGNKDGTISDFEKYGDYHQTVSSGISLDFLYDSRQNSINADSSAYLSIVYSPKLKWLKSDYNWQALQIDARKYIALSKHTRSILAFWSLITFVYGHSPYLDLPSTGWDLQLKSSGRGYTQGRYRGKNMLYLESEYRFPITANGLIGAVVFANAQSFSEMATNKFGSVNPGAGGGLRIKLNKNSQTNLCLDYGFGVNGSSGFFVNIGEIF